MINQWRRLKNRGQRGDTIVEVMLSIVVLSVVLVAAYVLSSHSLSSGVDAQKRSKALSIAQGQVSQLINAQNGLSGGLTRYTTVGKAFCINNDGTSNTTTHTGSNGVVVCATDSSGYATGISYNVSTKVFTVTTQWPGSAASKTNQAVLYYKAPGTYSAPNDVCPNIDGVQTTVPTGFHLDTSGNCVADSVDVCPNIAGVQTTIPTGYTVDSSGNCVTGGGGGFNAQDIFEK